MTCSYYVIFSRHGLQRFTKTDQFELKSGEYVVKMSLDVPDELFKTPPMPEVRLTITPNMLQRSLTASVGPTLGEIQEATFEEVP